LKGGNLPFGRGKEIVFDIMGKTHGDEGSLEYEKEADRVALVFDKSEKLHRTIN